ncbi:molecular chaperone Hsp33 [Endobacter medicaginis]|uniref:Hsp33 family molecular chaperone HslO n=1 Tax=Endobacter medicaginis TaxID=1181271 RepID=A0A850NU15_9PROT|nr:Hsp33 family molecular chaperone HslO [Endobacter medicaginis]MBB3174042.1 molecular chaperone Hsp33 [Endobacter medicaginis]MCX5477027.1 Hsp33 family molecular chaperone HslO [Endobacter medicaginis]NVN30922.1 Hsp33 family molecular chaperone HslO [Endobacter medicaginis]
MVDTPAFLDSNRPAVPDLVVSRGVLPFHLPNRPVRGRLVRLGPLADALLTRHDNPDPVTALTGEALALVAGLATALKFQGSFSLQSKGDGPVPMLLADCTEAGALRGYARVDAEKLEALLERSPEPSAAELLGSGYLAFTVDQGGASERQQGIVAIEGDSLSDMAMHYFETSEQLACEVRLSCARRDGQWRAAALVIERVARAGGLAGSADLPANDDQPEGDDDLPENDAAWDEAWREATALAATVTDDELLDDELMAEDVLYRLFHENGVAVDRPRALAYGCRCSRSRLAGILETFPPDDLDHMTVGRDIVMTCEFCNYDFRFARDSVRGA